MLRNLILLVVSVGISVLVVEGLLRLVLNPVDYLMVKPVRDDFLNHRIGAHDGGHDAWGFRNGHVPESSEIVAIGDSMTYGMMAKSDESWPAHLGRRLDKPIYNLGLGGYGPLQYLHLLKTRAAPLGPTKVIVSLYLGNDLFDVYNLAYGNDNWAAYRRDAGDRPIDDPELLTAQAKTPLFGRIRDWLAKNSVIYRLVTQSRIFDRYRVDQAVRLSTTSFVQEISGQLVMLDPKSMMKFVDMRDPRIATALDITLTVLSDIRDFCRQNAIDLSIVVIPVKENVYWPAVQDLASENLQQMRILTDNLDLIRSTLFKFFEESDIPYIDTLSPLRNGVLKNALYPEADGHPNGQGYAVIADAIARTIETTASPIASPVASPAAD